MIISKETFKIAKDSVDYAIQLEGEIKRLEKELQETKAQLKQKDEEIDRAVEVINSYADTGLFCPNVFGSDADQQQCKCGRTHLVGGKKAREFLKSIEGER